MRRMVLIAMLLLKPIVAWAQRNSMLTSLGLVPGVRPENCTAFSDLLDNSKKLPPTLEIDSLVKHVILTRQSAQNDYLFNQLAGVLLPISPSYDGKDALASIGPNAYRL